MNEAQFFELLQQRAETIASDIAGDMPEHADNVAYDLYVEVLQYDEIVGVIDMGDLYCEVFMDCDDGTIEIDPSLNPHDTIGAILKKRMALGGK